MFSSLCPIAARHFIFLFNQLRTFVVISCYLGRISIASRGRHTDLLEIDVYQPAPPQYNSGIKHHCLYSRVSYTLIWLEWRFHRLGAIQYSQIQSYSEFEEKAVYSVHYTTLHYTTLHYTTLHYTIALYYS